MIKKKLLKMWSILFMTLMLVFSIFLFQLRWIQQFKQPESQNSSMQITCGIGQSDKFNLSNVDELGLPTFYEDLNDVIVEWYGSALPTNRVTWDLQHDKNGNLELVTLQELVENFIINFINDIYGDGVCYNEDLTVDDVIFVFDVDNQTLLNEKNGGVYLKGNSERTYGKTTHSMSASYSMFRVNLDSFNQVEVGFSEFLWRQVQFQEQKIYSIYGESIFFKYTFAYLETILDEWLVAMINIYMWNFLEVDYVEGFADYKTRYSILYPYEIDIIWILDEDLKIGEIESFDLVLTASPNSFAYGTVKINNVKNWIYYKTDGIEHPPEKEKGTFNWSKFTIILIIVILLISIIGIEVKDMSRKKK